MLSCPWLRRLTRTCVCLRQGNTALKTGDTAGAIAKYTEAIAACEADDSRSGGMGQSGANLLAVCLTNRGIARMSTK